MVAVFFLVFNYSFDASSNSIFDELKFKVFQMDSIAKQIVELPQDYRATVRALDFSPDGKYLAVRTAAEGIEIWDWRSQKIAQKLSLPKGANSGRTAESLKFSPDGLWLAACHAKGRKGEVISLWDTHIWGEAHAIRDEGPGTGCNSITFTPDNKKLIRILEKLPHAAGSNLVIYETTAWKPLWEMRTTPFYPTTLSMSPDGKRVAIGGEVVNSKGVQPDVTTQTYGTPAFDDTPLLAILDVDSGAITDNIKINGVLNDLSRIQWSPDGNDIAIAGGYGLQLVKLKTATSTAITPHKLAYVRTALRYSPDGRYLFEGIATGNKTGWGKIRDVTDMHVLTEFNEDVGSIAVSNDSRYFATGMNGKVIVWKIIISN